jgi:phosphate-selective porin OprO and OprP
LSLALTHRASGLALFGFVLVMWSATAASGQTSWSPSPDSIRAALTTLQAKPEEPRPLVRMDLDGRPTLVIGIVRLSPRAAFRAEITRSDAPLADEDESQIDIAKRRVGFEGAVGDYADFQVEYEIDDADPWRDVFVNVSPIRQVQLKFGKFKLPFGLEENTGSANLDFARRSLASRTLAPGRDRGVMVHGEVLDRFLIYEAGQFDHDGANAATHSAERVTGERTRAFRIVGVPLRRLPDEIDDLTIGAAWTESTLNGEGFSSIHAQTTLGDDFWESIWLVNGTRTRRGIEARWRPGPFAIAAEHIRLTEQRLGLSVEDSDLSPIASTGWYVSGTWAVTGDAKEEGLIATKHPIGKGIGAVELGVRLEGLEVGSGTAEAASLSPRAETIVGNSLKAVTFGVNWYLNRWLKVQANIIRETITDPSQGPLPSQPTYWGRVIRFQFSL